jgi:hypothetical protein
VFAEAGSALCALILDLGGSVSELTCDGGGTPKWRSSVSDLPITVGRAEVEGSTKLELRPVPDLSGFGRRTDITE